MARKEEAKKGGAPAWMVTFSDLVTLLLTFFVLLLSFANTDLIKYKEAVGSLKEAFGVQTKEIADFPSQSSTPLSLEVAAPKPFSIIEQDTLRGARSKVDSTTKDKEKHSDGEKKSFEELGETLKNYIMNEGLEGEFGLSVEEGRVVLRAVTKELFAPGSATIVDFDLLKKVAFLLKTRTNFNLTIEGHTDDTATKAGTYPSNWELSAIRATTALRFLSQSGISENRLRALAYGSAKPYLPNTNPSNREKNRRIEFVFTLDGWD